MVDPKDIKSTLHQIILELDPSRYGVAIAHLQDAIAALDAVAGGAPTKYALHDRLIRGQSVAEPKRRQVR